MPQDFPLGPVNRFRQRVRKGPGLLPLLTQGDSWFSFPTFLNANIIDFLIAMNEGRAAWLRLGSYRNDVRQMLSGTQYRQLQSVLSDPTSKVAGILFSGGGNDIVGESLLSLLNHAEKGMAWMDCINLLRFERRLGEIESAYEELIDLRDDFQPDATVFTHAYDYPVPSDRPFQIGRFMKVGPWMKPYMDSKGIDNESDQRAIMHYMLTRLDGLMRKIEQEHDRIVYVRTQGTLTKEEWQDELHPTPQGFRKMAAIFQEALTRVFPSLSRDEVAA